MKDLNIFLEEPDKCPECGSEKFYRAASYRRDDEIFVTYKCDCGRKWTAIYKLSRVEEVG